MKFIQFDGMIESRGVSKSEINSLVNKLNSVFPTAFVAEFSGTTFSIYASGKKVKTQFDGAAIMCADLLRPLIKLVPLSCPIESTLRCVESQDNIQCQSVFIFGSDIEVVSRSGIESSEKDEGEMLPKKRQKNYSLILGISAICLFVGFFSVKQIFEFKQLKKILLAPNSGLDAMRGAFKVDFSPDSHAALVSIQYLYPDKLKVDGSEKNPILQHALNNGDFELAVKYVSGKIIKHNIKYDEYKSDTINIRLVNYDTIVNTEIIAIPLH